MKKSTLTNTGTPMRRTVLALAAATALALTSCGAYNEDRHEGSTAESPAATAQVQSLVISETWAKAIDVGMTSAFGVIKNPTGTDITVIGVSTPASKTAELHETVTAADGTMKMQAKEGGFTVPSHGELLLEPGAGHIMLMELAKPVQAGDEIILTLELSNGQEQQFTAVVKDFSGANENYGDIAGHEGMEHGTESPTHAK